MSLVRVVALEPCNRYKPGESWECGEREALELESLGLVKMALVPRNKMAPDPANKSHPMQAAGEDAQQSSLPAARHSPAPTVRLSASGKRLGRPPRGG